MLRTLRKYQQFDICHMLNQLDSSDNSSWRSDSPVKVLWGRVVPCVLTLVTSGFVVICVVGRPVVGWSLTGGRVVGITVVFSCFGPAGA